MDSRRPEGGSKGAPLAFGAGAAGLGGIHQGLVVGVGHGARVSKRNMGRAHGVFELQGEDRKL